MARAGRPLRVRATTGRHVTRKHAILSVMHSDVLFFCSRLQVYEHLNFSFQILVASLDMFSKPVSTDDQRACYGRLYMKCLVVRINDFDIVLLLWRTF